MTPEQFDKKFNFSLKNNKDELEIYLTNNIRKSVDEILKSDGFKELSSVAQSMRISTAITTDFSNYSIKLIKNVMKDILTSDDFPEN